MTTFVSGRATAWHGARNRTIPFPSMEWATPQHLTKAVDWAGRTYIKPETFGALWDPIAYGEHNNEAVEIISNWRSSHAFPLNTFQVWLRRRAQAIDANALVAQRIKRLASIEQKLKRFKWLTLSEMQDIGGCRAVVTTAQRVRVLVAAYEQSNLKHKLDDRDDYISQPKTSGYRGVHLIYRYYSDRKQTYNDLKIEIQLRSSLQHAWATAVETVDIFTEQALKAGRGKKDWRRFFAIMGTALARREKTPEVPNTPTTKKELVDELRHYVEDLGVIAKLRGFNAVLQSASNIQNARYFLVTLKPKEQTVTVRGFRYYDAEEASREYLNVEKAINKDEGEDAVLVSVESMEQLREAYPNYFLDTHRFVEAVEKAIA